MRLTGRTNTAENLKTITALVGWGRMSGLVGRYIEFGTPETLVVYQADRSWSGSRLASPGWDQRLVHNTAKNWGEPL